MDIVDGNLGFALNLNHQAEQAKDLAPSSPTSANPCTPDTHEVRATEGKRYLVLSEPTMEPEARKTFRQSPTFSARKSLTQPSTLNAKRSGVKSSDFRGVSKCAKDGRWQSRIRVGKKVKYLGRFKTEADAAARYDEAALALHGRRATLNFELTEDQLEKVLARIAEKRLEFGFDETDATEASHSPRPSTSRGSSRSTSPTEAGEESEEDTDPSADDQSAAMSLMWLKLHSGQ